MAGLTVDAWGVGFSVREGRVFVHFPRFDETGARVYGVGIPVDVEPEIARNGIRAELFRKLLER